MNFSIHQTSHIGNRRFNQDRVGYAYSNEALLMVLADGMGGHLHGELAATVAVETFIETFGLHAHSRLADPDAFIVDTMRYAHERIMKLPHDQEMGGFPGTTCAAVLIQDGQMYWGHAGDSRIYLLRDGDVYARTTDHSMVQRLVDMGRLSAEEARVHAQRNQITNCLGGIQDLFYVESGPPLPLKSGDVILLGSDGLWGPFTDRELVEAFIAHPVAEVLDDLVQSALRREYGHSDNVTGVSVRWGEREAEHQTREPVSEILDIL